MPILKDLSGMQFSEWLVLSRVIVPDKTQTFYNCRCSCGNERIVQAGHLNSGASKSCGCSNRGGNTTHGNAKSGKFTKKYKTWRYVRERCLNENHKNANIYHGLLCDEWLKFENFDRDVPDPPADDLSIDRIDNSKGYEPNNVRWVTMAEQHRNQSNCRWIEFNDKTQLLSDWAKELDISPEALIGRIERNGVEKALTAEKGKRIAPAHNKLFITKDGVTDSIKGWSERLNVSEVTVRKRIKKGEFQK